MRGTVVGYGKVLGFVRPDDGGKDVFVHRNDAQANGVANLKNGDRVSFEIGSGEDGRPRATKIVMIERAAKR